MPGVYIHIPFCVQKCRYCDFVSFCGDTAVMQTYLDALETEMEQYKNTAAETVFLGGGTPTCLPPAVLARLLELVQKNFRLAPEGEFSVEANPGTLTPEKLSILKDSGVNRLSIGVQSFQDDELQMLGRIHSAQTAQNTVYMAKNAGFSNINLDLMSGLPYQTAEKFQKTLEQAVALEPTHISCYSLIVEEGTPLAASYARGEFSLPDEEDDRAMYELACDFLERHGYRQYEISNFAKPGFACRHNLLYWDCQPYIGLGAAAHGFDGTVRTENTPDLAKYLRGEGIGAVEAVLSQADKISEFMMLGLRKTDGISETEFYQRFGMTVDAVFSKEISKFVAGGFLARADGKLALTRQGISVSNSILCEFIIDAVENT